MSAMPVPAVMLEAKDLEHRVELAKAHMLVAVYRATLVEHGIEPPDPTGEDLLQMWRNASAVISSASEFVAHLGTSKELLSGQSWRPEPISAP
jgi:hypothetical protein